MAVSLTERYISSVEGLLGHLDDDDDEVVQSSLQSLLELIPYHWSEIADKLTQIEALSEDDDFEYKTLASLLASKIFFHIQSYEDSLNHALCAGEYFNIKEDSDYVRKLTEQCIDSYRTFMQEQYRQTKEKQPLHHDLDDEIDDDDDNDNDSDGDVAVQNNDGNDENIMSNINEEIDKRKVDIVEKVFKHCYEIGEFKHAIGIAVECRRIDRVEEALKRSNDQMTAMLNHCFTLCETVISSRTFRDEMLELIVRIYGEVSDQNYNNICRCYFYLDTPQPISDILWKLINNGGSQQSELSAYQIAFDLYEFQNDAFLRGIFNNIPSPPRSQLELESESDKQSKKEVTSDVTTDATDINATDINDDNANDDDPPKQTGVVDESSEHWTEDLLSKWKSLKSILLGARITELCLDFLFRNSRSDLLILAKMKEGISERNSVLNNSLICCNAIMHCGTTIDQFLRDNLEWMGRAAHWCKFTATASVGMIHHHHVSASQNVLQRYLPGSGGGPYQEGGALYALGLIHCGDNSDLTLNFTRNYLLKHLKQASNEILQHGSCLGLGLAALGYGSQEDDGSDNNARDILVEIRNVLFQDRAVPGEAAGLSIGLILCGSGNREWYSEMLAYAHETAHEKIIRGLVMGIAIMHYNLQEKADYAVTALINDRDETIRYGGCYTIGLSYAATGNTMAVQKLLHLAVSDVSDDVRRAAVTNIGFVLCNKPSQVPSVLSLLSNSYNPHVRYGAAAALGIACAGTGDPAALKILKTLAQDPVDYVRQSALIAIGMLLMQHNAEETPAVKEIREVFLQGTVTDKREPTMSAMGAILGCGMIDAAGRNVTISLFNTKNNCKRQSAIIGMSIFWQYWYWYPLLPFITLCFKPTMCMALNHELEMPQLKVSSRNENRKMFDYVPHLKEEKKGKKKKLTKVVLSVQAKTAQRNSKKKKEIGKAKEEAEVVDDVVMSEILENEAVEAVDDDKKLEEEKSNDDYLSNPCRVTPNQEKYIEWCDTRYKPMTYKLNGFVMVQDTKPNEKVELVQAKKMGEGGVYGDEPDPPKPFVYLGN